MPIPTPAEGEDQDTFHSRCMRAVYDEYGQEQGNAICFSQWRRHHGEKSIDTGTGLVAYDLQGQRKKEASMIGGPKRLYGRIEKVEEVGDGTIKVHGIASTEDQDDQGEIVRASAMRDAIPDYMRFASVREMHGLTAAGRALECNCGNDDITRIVAHVVDPIAISKVKHRVYNGFSIGGRVLERAAGDNKTITRLALHEISLVDRPANPGAVIDLWKSKELGDRPMPDGSNGLGTIGDIWADAMAKVGPQIWPCANQSHRHGKKDEAARCIAEEAMKKRGQSMMTSKDDGMMMAMDWMKGDPVKAMEWMKRNPQMAADWMKANPAMAMDWMKRNPKMAGDWMKANPDMAMNWEKHGLPGQNGWPNAEKHGLPGQNGWPHAEKHGEPGQNDLPKEWDTEKHGLPGQNGWPHAEKHGLPGQELPMPGEPPGGENSEANFDGDHDSDDDETSAESAGGSYWPESGADRRSDFGKKKNGNGSKPYGDVRYADPGYQSDGKKRYPIDNEKHVRAAWSYINQADNARAYSSEQLGRVKARIKAGAKRYGIEISEKARFDLDDPDALVKSLATSCVDQLIEQLPYDDDMVIEKAGRRMAAADQFMMTMAHDMIGKMTDMAFCMKANPEANATQDTAGMMQIKEQDAGPDSGTAHYRLGENSTQDTAKRGMRHSTATMGYLRKAHDNLCRAGAACPAHDGMMGMGMMGKSSTTEDQMTVTTDDEGAAVAAALKKALKKNDKLSEQVSALTTQVSNLTVHMEYLAKGSKGEPPPPAPAPEKTKKFEKALAARDAELAEMKQLLQQIAKQPVPGSASHLPPGIIDISKGQDGGQMRQAVTEEQLKAAKEVHETWQKMSEEEKFFASLKISHLNPYSQQRR